MLRNLLIKELRDHLLALRLQMGFVLAIALVSTSAFVLAASYERQRTELTQAARAEDDFLRLYSHSNRLGGVLQTRRPPAPLMLVRGISGASTVETLQTDPMRELFAPLDFTFVVGVVLSLLGIVLGFDAVSAEKERGTLRQVLANRLRRSDVIMAKWMAGCAVLAVTLAMAGVVAGLVITLRVGGAWSAAEWAAYGVVLLVAWLYCSAFFTVGLAASALSRSSSVSVLTALFAWVCFVLIIPNISPYLAAQAVRLPAVAALERDVQFITSEERDDIGRRESQRIWDRYPDLRAALGDVASDELKRRLAADSALRARYELMRNESEALWARVNQQQRANANRLLQDSRARNEQQLTLSGRLAGLSPLSSLTFALTDLADTGFAGVERYQHQADEYGRTLREFIEQRYQEEQRRNPTFSVNDFLDVSARPRFTYRPPPIAERVTAAAPHIGLLLAWNAVFLLCGLVAFRTYDVR